MAEITASMVKELREKTDAPMMECKKALAEAAGNMQKAEEILRVKLGIKAGKAASRVAAEGIVGLHIDADGKKGAIIEVNCETDFVAKNDEFIAFTKKLAELVVEKNPADVETLLTLDIDGTSVEAIRVALVGKIGENMSIRRFMRKEGKGKLASYVHNGSKIGVMVDLTGGDAALARDVAMHIAAAKPKAIDVSGIDAELIESERRVASEKMIESETQSGKKTPPDIAAKRIEGTVAKFLKEVTLLGQPFVKDDKVSIEQLLKSKSAKIEDFSLFIVGEGIEKKTNDFAAEVAAQAAAAQK